MIIKWVNEFRLIGPDALKPRMKWRKKTLDKITNHTKKQLDENNSINTSVERINEPEDELLKLSIENAFLKELRRLHLDGEAKMRELHESSAVYEDNLRLIYLIKK